MQPNDAMFMATYKPRSCGKDSTCPTNYAKEFFTNEKEMNDWVNKMYALPVDDPKAVYYTVVDLVTLNKLYSNY